MLGMGSRGGEEREREEKLWLPNGVVLANEQIKQLLKSSVWGCDELDAYLFHYRAVEETEATVCCLSKGQRDNKL